MFCLWILTVYVTLLKVYELLVFYLLLPDTLE